MLRWPPDYLGSAMLGVRNREYISWPDLKPLLPFTLTGVLVALYIFDQDLLNKLLGYFVLFFAIYQLLPLPPLRASRIVAAPIGLIGGFVGTLFGTGGPFYVMYLTMRGLDKTKMRASFATYFMLDGTVRLFGYLVVGFFSISAITKIAVVAPAAAPGLFVGGKVHRDISQQLCKYFISLILVVSGTGLLLK